MANKLKITKALTTDELFNLQRLSIDLDDGTNVTILSKNPKLVKDIYGLIFGYCEKKNNNIEERKAQFMRSVIDATAKFPDKELVEDFIRCWTEHSPNGKKMRFEMQKTFSINGRLATFIKNKKTNFGKGFGKYGNQQQPAVHTKPTIPVRGPEVKKAERTPEQQRNDMIGFTLSVFELHKQGQPYAGAPRVYDFLVAEGKIRSDDHDDKEIKAKVTAKVEVEIYDFKVNNKININSTLKATEGPKVDVDNLYKKIALTKYFNALKDANKNIVFDLVSSEDIQGLFKTEKNRTGHNSASFENTQLKYDGK